VITVVIVGGILLALIVAAAWSVFRGVTEGEIPEDREGK
jgi:hypothetical protein